MSPHVPEQFTRLLLLGPGEAMRQDERDAGHAIIKPGDVPWLSRYDWPDDVVISREGDTIRIVAIFALRPGTGAFTRMIDGILAAGLKPVVVVPGSAMRAILTRWGWRANGDEWWPQSVDKPV